MTVSVSRVKSSRDVRDFVEVPLSLYRPECPWVAPLSSSVKRLIDAKTNAFHREAIIEHFVARDQHGRCVGRVAATIHPDYIRRHGEKAFFGFFESVDNLDVARSLLAAVEHWAADRGIRQVAGPCSYTTTQEAGLLVEGFELPPAVLQPYNPPYYVTLLERCGYAPAFELAAYTATRAAHGSQSTRLVELGDTVAARYGLSVRSVDLKRYDAELESLRLLYNRAFGKHPQTAPISRAVFADQVSEMRQIIDPRIVRLVEREGEMIGFVVLLPNVNEVLARNRGRLSLSLMLHWKRLLASIRSVVVVMVGADPELAPKGVGCVIAREIARSMLTGQYDTVHTTWIHEDNSTVRSLMERSGSRPTKRYAIYQRALS